MKNTILLVIICILLTGCSQKNEPTIQVDDTVDVQPVAFDNTKKYHSSTDKKSTYNNEELNISFEYPLNWKIETDERFINTVFFAPEWDTDRTLIFDYQSESFEQYEIRRDIGQEPPDLEVGEVYFTTRVENIHFADNEKYPARRYTSHESVLYIIEIDGKYVSLAREYPLNQEEIEVLEEILNSLYNTM